jgi:SAM-dependent methyltransferase
MVMHEEPAYVIAPEVGAPRWCERTVCLCGASSAAWTVLTTVSPPTAPVPTIIVRCTRCDIGFSTPYIDESTVAMLYDPTANDTNFERIGTSVIDRLKDWNGARELRAMVPKGSHGSVKRVLDFGTGNGRFALLARRVFRGAAVDAIDYQSEVPPALAGVSGLHYQTVGEWMLGGVAYDLIVLRHVLEHNHDPVALLRALRDRLSPTGRNLDSWWVKWLGKRVNTWAVPFHLWQFSAHSLRTQIEAAGLHATIGTAEMPLAGTALAMLIGRPKSLAFQLAGVALHPIQLALSASLGAPCLTALCARGELTTA